jgi:hypothetical protein
MNDWNVHNLVNIHNIDEENFLEDGDESVTKSVNSKNRKKIAENGILIICNL